MAKTIRSPGRPFSVGVRIPPWTAFARGLYPGLLAYVNEHDPWRIETAEDTTHEIPPVRIDEHWQGDGLIVFRCSAKEYRAWTRRGIRVVCISSETPPRMRTPLACVTPDNPGAGRLAADHLLGRGLSRLACWSDPTRRYACDRARGFSERARAAGCEVTLIEKAVSEIPMARRWKTIETELLKRLPGLPTPVGFFTKDDISAASVIRACQIVGLRVPEDVAVIGCNNDPAFVYTTTPSLTSVDYPAFEIGWHAASLLDRMMKDPHFAPEQPTHIPAGPVIERQSTMVFGYDDPLAAEVWLYILRLPDNHACQVKELANHLAVAEPTLRRKFRLATGRSVKSVIDEARLRRVQHQLQTTSLSIKRIAFACGFQASEDLARFFRRHTAMSPSQFRTHHRAPHQAKPSGSS